MARQVLLYLTFFFKRLHCIFMSRSRQADTTPASTSAILLMIALSLYIAGGLGYFVKTHYWDHLSGAQKTAVLEAMASSEPTL